MMVSFVLPAYKAKYLHSAVQSILAQSVTELELVVVNDSSPENLDEIVYSFKDDRIRYFVNEKNIGGHSLVEQWNHCIEFAKGDWIVLASDDDLYHPDFLKYCLELAARYPRVDLVHSRVRQIDEEGKRCVWEDGLLPEFTGKFEFFHYWMKAGVFVCMGNYLFRSSVLKEKQFVDFPCAFGSDSASAIMMSQNGVANTAAELFSFRHSAINLSSSIDVNILRKKLIANTMQFEFFKSLNWTCPENDPDGRFAGAMSPEILYSKCKYDYYNLVIKFLPLSKLGWINDCELLKRKDKVEMFVRYFYDKIFK